MTWMLQQPPTGKGWLQSDRDARLLEQYRDMWNLHRARPSNAVLPDATHSDVPGTWSYDTVNRRLREEILKRTFHENAEFLQTHPESLQRLQALDQEMGESLTTPLRYLPEVEKSNKGARKAGAYSLDVEKADIRLWNEVVLPKWVAKDATWASAPWLVAELFFYRRISHAFDYFTTLYDPFEKQKMAGLRGCAPMLLRFGESLRRMNDPAGCTPDDAAVFRAGLRSAILGALKGNAADLSLWPCSHEEAETQAGQETTASSVLGEDDDESACILCDDFDAFFEDVRSQFSAERSAKKERKAVIFVDNAGSEVLTDMWLACVLLEYKVVDKVVFYVKEYPIFVSDALPKDFQLTYTWIQQQASKARPTVSALANLWRSYVERGRWEVKAHTYFCMPFEYSDMPSELYAELRDTASVLISKGDANYRRILGDRAWSIQTPFSRVAQYAPCPLLALRKLKADVACGISAEKQKHAEETDKEWMVNGKWGVIHYFNPRCVDERPLE
ncbi:DUF89/Fructose bisphosphatase [Besnoitia besnoiti]|uniref:Sugar phosphate phosphatase n=1 Tax=Besnoitia besnoiti TaxID=94643 RepID=A0A2A9MF17_BESBE|nr:DUF89/Fructose bisphosphatase [Besnoitia besnoiti]PFH34263.1 DUF89/Fructose bisphosphatase [Besnoitia besnoiti]